MRHALTVTGLGLVLMVLGCAAPVDHGAGHGSDAWAPSPTIVNDDPDRVVDLETAFARLQNAWDAGHIRSVDVLHIPVTSEFGGNVSSSIIEVFYEFRLTNRDAGQSALATDLAAVIRNLRPESSGSVADLRWACIFSKADQRVFSIYFDRTGRRGVVEGACVQFDSDALLRWAESYCTHAFR